MSFVRKWLKGLARKKEDLKTVIRQLEENLASTEEKLLGSTTKSTNLEKELKEVSAKHKNIVNRNAAEIAVLQAKLIELEETHNVAIKDKEAELEAVRLRLNDQLTVYNGATIERDGHIAKLEIVLTKLDNAKFELSNLQPKTTEVQEANERLLESGQHETATIKTMEETLLGLSSENKALQQLLVDSSNEHKDVLDQAVNQVAALQTRLSELEAQYLTAIDERDQAKDQLKLLLERDECLGRIDSIEQNLLSEAAKIKETQDQLKAELAAKHNELVDVRLKLDDAHRAGQDSSMQLADALKRTEVLQMLSRKLHDQRDQAIAEIASNKEANQKLKEAQQQLVVMQHQKAELESRCDELERAEKNSLQATNEKLAAQMVNSLTEVRKLETERDHALATARESALQLAETFRKRDVLEALSKKLQEQRNQAISDAGDLKVKLGALQDALTIANIADARTQVSGVEPNEVPQCESESRNARQTKTAELSVNHEIREGVTCFNPTKGARTVAFNTLNSDEELQPVFTAIKRNAPTGQVETVHVGTFQASGISSWSWESL